MTRNGIDFSQPAIAAFCRKWRVHELALFGSVLRSDFRAESDVDVLVTFEPGEAWDLWDIVTMKEELETMLGRPVDLVERKTLRNPIRRQEILSHSEVIYAT
jgi:predicted nucleotidyltransferase